MFVCFLQSRFQFLNLLVTPGELCFQVGVLVACLVQLCPQRNQPALKLGGESILLLTGCGQFGVDGCNVLFRLLEIHAQRIAFTFQFPGPRKGNLFYCVQSVLPVLLFDTQLPVPHKAAATESATTV